MRYTNVRDGRVHVVLVNLARSKVIRAHPTIDAAHDHLVTGRGSRHRCGAVFATFERLNRRTIFGTHVPRPNGLARTKNKDTRVSDTSGGGVGFWEKAAVFIAKEGFIG